MWVISQDREPKLALGERNVPIPAKRGNDARSFTLPNTHSFGNSQRSMPIPKFNANTWFAQFTAGGTAIAAEELQPVLEFTLIWNLFEKLVCERNAGLPRIRRHVEQSIEQNKINGADYHPYVEFFKERYQDPSEEFLISVLLSRGRLPSRADREDIKLVKTVFEGNYTDINNVVYALLFIAYLSIYMSDTALPGSGQRTFG